MGETEKKNKSGLIINSSFSHPVGFISQTQAGTREPARAADPNICQAGGGSRLASPSVSGPLTYVLAYAWYVGTGGTGSHPAEPMFALGRPLGSRWRRRAMPCHVTSSSGQCWGCGAPATFSKQVNQHPLKGRGDGAILSVPAPSEELRKTWLRLRSCGVRAERWFVHGEGDEWERTVGEKQWVSWMGLGRLCQA